MFKTVLSYGAADSRRAATSCVPSCTTCAHLRATALAIIGSDGLDALTLERLGTDAQLPLSVVEGHYATASNCLYDTYEEVSEGIYKDFAWAFDHEPRWRNALRLASKTLLRRMAKHPEEARLCFAEILQGDYELLRRREANRKRLVRLFVRELGRRRDRPELLAMQLELLIGAGFQAIVSAVAEGRVAELDSLASELESRAFVFEPVAA